MKTLKLLALSCLVLLTLACSTDSIESESSPKSTDELDLRTSGFDDFPDTYEPTEVLIEWEFGITYNEKKELRKSYSKSGYILSWWECPTDHKKEVWIVNHCVGCHPFHDPGDNTNVKMAAFHSLCIL